LKLVCLFWCELFRYTNGFDPDNRYGKPLKWLPPGVWFKSNVQPKSSNENKNTLTDCVSKLLERYDTKVNYFNKKVH